ncbi:uncharacterized protein LOC119909328 [Micropterus salmoides]|uniref:uncharacterized protein LOC119909328 n=1 Tax=Micropterus salmoides TaxID=27706 RepID=UPI0018ED52DD|nr:uncharacterized protein LOC119909328 [Micropterus salmoides]
MNHNVRMALPKAVGYMVVLVVICYSLEAQGYTQSLDSSDYVLQVVLNISDLEHLRTLLNTFSPVLINNTVEINSIAATTVCSPNTTGYQCRCEPSFAWSYNSCIDYGACDAIIDDTCGCINGLPADGQYCQLNTSLPEVVIYDIALVLEWRIPVSSVPSDFIELFRNTVRKVLLPYTITQSLNVTGLNFTTGCYPNSTGGLQCHCEEQFAWSCDQCNIYGACSNATSQTCGCINGLPSDGALCEPITNITPCPTPPPEVVIYDIALVLEWRIPVSSVPSDFIELFRNTVRKVLLPYTITQSLNVTGLNFTTGCYPNSTGGLQCHCEEQFAWSCDQCNIYGACSNATSQTCGCINGLPSDGALCEPITNITPCPTPPPEVVIYDIALVLEWRIPVSSVPSDFIELFRNTVRKVLLPYTITQSLNVTGLNFTTGCYPNSTGGLQCHCEEQFAWSCDQCNIYGACSNATSQTCGCINGLPSDGALCEPITNITPCPTPPPEVVIYDIALVLEWRIPVSSVPSDFIELFRNTVRKVLLPYTITQSLNVTGLNFTTGCYPNSTGGLQCHCEEQFAWSCDQCNIYGACSNATSQTCGCINGLPSDGALCEPITNITPCPTPPPEVVIYDIALVLEWRIPVSSVPSDFIELFRNTVRKVLLPYTITQSLNVTGLNFTTGCYPNSTGGLQCHCEEQFAWSCDQCNIYGACSNATSQTCGCINGLPSDGALCEPITNITPCPTPPPEVVIYDIALVLEWRIPVSSVPSDFIELFRNTVRKVLLPYTITQSLNVTGLNFTTGCYPNSTGGLQCHCEEQFAWSCDQCNIYGACSNATSQTCGCINGLPSDGALCEPITNITPCPTPPPEVVIYDIALVLEWRIPVSSVPSDFIELFRNTVRKVLLPYTITQSLNVTGLNFTTGCYPNSTGGLQCHCEEQFAWSCDQCNIYGACSNATSQTCGCINGLPSDGALCEPITNITPCPTPPPEVVIYDIALVLEWRIPVSSVPSDFIELFRNTVRKVLLPYTITQSLNVTGLNFTTGCYPNSTGGLQCHCEEQFAWSCDQCNIYGACSNATSQTCGCINGLPSDGALCEPITNITPCPTPPPEVVIYDIALVLEWRIPVSSVPSDFIELFRNTVRKVLLPYTITQSLNVTGLNFTTGCYPNSTGGLQCHCEEQFAWSCDQCNIYGACSNATSQTCGCINGLPSDGALCEPITNITPCPTPPPEVVIYDIALVLEWRIPVSSVPSDFIELFRNTVRKVLLPYTITQSLNVTGLNFTTGCYPNSTGGLQCHCEEQFAWSCDQCNIYGACSNATSQTCGCINGLPSDGALCEPITNITPCPTPPPEVVIYDIALVLEWRIPVSSVPSDFIELFRNTVRKVLLPYTITQSLNVTGLNFTTGCYPNSTGGLQCHCEEQFAWSCDQCNIYGACSNATSQTCGCINGLPSDGALCEPITNITPCPTPPPEVVIYDIALVLEWRIPVSSVPSDFIELFRNTVRKVLLPYTITQSLNVTGLNFTTGCYPNSTGGLQCHCEEQFAWSCDQCNIYGACSNATSQTCGCINGLPSDGALCEPITNITPCPTPPPEVVIYDIALVLEWRIPVSSVPSDFIELFRNTVRKVLLPYTITQSLNVTGLNFTTGCYPNSTGGLQCHCEEQFAWSCDQCNIYGACSNATSQTCGCINGLPSDGALCEPITNITPCPTPPPEVVIYDIALVLEWRIPVSSVPSDFIELFRNTVRKVLLPYTITQSLNVTGLNFTTGCYPNSTGGLQCHCEEQFAWSCDQCNIYGACSNATSQTCGCINGLPSDGALCEPITNITPCPTPPPEVVIYDIALVLEWRIPVSSVPSDFIELFRNTVRKVLLPYTITQSLNVTGLNFTTGCYPNSTGGLQCHCEEQFAWSCDQCNIYGACSNATSQTCGCINGLPSDGALCEPITNITPCPTPPPEVVIYDIALVLEWRIPVSSVPSDFIELFRNTVRKVLLPYTITQSLNVTGLNFTTGCYPNSTGGLQCHCEEQFAWSCDQCNIYGACSNATSQTCGCINGLPSDGALCEPITNITPCPTPPPEVVIYDIALVLEWRIPVSSVPSDFIELFRNTVRKVLLPYTITQSLNVTGLNFTTGCYPNSTGGLQCHCEEQFAWSCDQCNIYGACSNATSQTCGCINGLPSDGALCEPITNITPCPTPPPEVVIYDIALVLEWRIPVSSVPSDFIELFRNTVRKVLLPYTITQSLNVTGLNFTTGCYPNSTGGLQCHCEEQFAWSCDQCNIYGACSNATSQTCGCINGLPSDGALCEPITNITPCPTPPPEVVIYDIALVLEWRIPVSSVPSDFIELFRNTVRKVLLPYTITQSLNVTGLNFTTGCYPNSTGGLQCHCEEQFAWSCDQCNIYGACSNATSQTCGCINGLPSDGALCEPITNITPCPTPPPEVVIYDIALVLEWRIPVSSVPSDFIELFRNTVRKVLLPYTITQSLNVTGLNFTTGCYPNSTGGLQCHCEEQFAWSCDQCNIYGACSNATSQTCGCINGLPSDGALCEPITNITPCPTPPPEVVIYDIALVLEWRIPVSSVPSDFIELFRNTVRKVLLPYTITQSLNVTGLNFTTGCYPNSTGGLQCHCEEQFAWSCDQCNIYGACSNATSQTCGCINGLPSDGALCEPITNITPCPTPPPEVVIYDIALVLEWRIPVSSVPSDFIELFRNTVRKVLLPYTITQSLNVTGLNFTTGCYPNSTGGLQCHCEEQFAWSCDQCNIYGACSNATSQTCGCINGLPSDGALCEPITNITPCPTPPPEVVIYDIALVLEWRIPVSSVPSDFIELFRNTVRKVLLPYTITQSLNVTGLNFTTGCYPNSTGGLQCHCEEQFAWSCDQCNIYGACSNATSQTCGCINGLPSDGALCEPITNITPCPTPPPEVVIYDIALVLEWRIPVSSVPSDFIELFRNTVRKVLLPYTITQSLNVTGLNFTTGCYPNSTGGLQCHCEEQFAWSCDQCNIYGACSNATSQTCGCINGLPSDGALCEPITNITPCPTPPPEVVIYDIALVLEWRIPVSSVPSDFIELFRNTVRKVLLPYTITQSLNVTGLNFTTGCYPNSTGGLQCHCEEQFAWSCDQCNIYGACSNATSQTCGCINGLPSDGALCEPITNITPCPTPPPEVVIYDIALVLEWRIPVSSVPSDFIELFRNTVRKVLLPYTITQSLNVTGLNFTTGCYPNSTGGLQCHCEEQFAWSCDQCNIYGACSNATSQTCGCINGLPSDGALCEPITNITPCPTPPPEVVIYDIALVLEWRIPVSSVPSDFIELFRNTVRKVLLPYTITQSLNVTGLNFTTGCYPNSTGGLQCHCEEQFAWSCDQCNIYGACSNATSQTCGCINGLPSDGALCEPITNITPCPTPPPEVVIYDIALVLEWRIPVSSVPSDFIELFRNTVRKVLLPYTITQSLNVTGLNFTTGCYPNSTGGLQCHCEEQFAWSCDQCNIYGACSNATSQTCGCINGLPSDGALCEPITNITPCPTPPPEVVIYDIALVLEWRIPVSSVPSDFIELFRNTVRKVLLPYTITQSLNVTGLNFTTGCYPNSTGGLQCHCEEQFAWSCDQCNIYGACSNATSQTCGCINGLPSDGALCEPITNITPCPTPPPEVVIYDIALVLEWRIPVSSVPSDFIELFRNTVRKVLLPYTITQSLNVTGLNFTTGCYPNSTGGLQCHCEEQFAWSCDQCNIYGACSNATSQTCGCINGLPSDGALCEPITNITPCPTPPPEVVIYDIALVLEWRIPVSSVPSDFIELFRNTVRKVLLPYTITQSLNVTGLNFTTGCYPNSTGGLQCHCEEQFAWSCDQCNIYGACSNATSQTCGCINGLPSDGALCEPITNITPCPTPPPEVVIYDIALVLEWRIPVSSVPSDFIELFRNTVRKVLLPYTITQSLNVTGLNFTTGCYPNSTGGLQCHCEEQFAWSCDQCNIYGACSNATSQTCGCINGLPSDGALCEPITNITPCPTPPPATTPMTTTTTPKTTTTTQVRNLNFTMDLVYDSTYNDQRSEVYRNTNISIQEQCNKHISTLVSVNIIGFKSGSTIVDYTVRANSINDMEIAAVTSGVFTQLGKIYPVIFDSSAPLTFNPPSVIFGESVTVTCGPPPKDLNFNTISTAEWTLNGTKILEDNEHHFGTANGAATLTVEHFFITDVGRYQCMLKDSGSRGIFRQISNGTYTFQNKPLIQVKPMKQLVQCGAVTSVTLQCSVNSPYNVVFNKENSPTGPAITYPFPIPSTCENQIVTCQVINHMEFNMNIKLVLTNDKLICVNDPVYGSGTLNYVAEAPCEPNYVGAKTAVCGSDGQWGNKQDNCVLQIVQQLFQQSQNLNSNSLPGFLEKLSSATVSFTEQVVNSPGTITAIVQILNNVANVSLSPNISITETSMKNILLTAGVLTINGSKTSWGYLNGNDTSNITATQRKSVSSAFLQSLENITSRLTNDSFNIDTPSILLNKTTFTNTFMADFDSSVEIDIPTSDGRSKFITVVTFASMDNVLPARDKGNSSIYVINGRVILVQSSGTVDNVSFTFDIINNTLGNAQCVFWNFSLFSGLGGWDNGGCVLVSNNTNVTCNCNHLTSFSILMSPYTIFDIVLDYITYIGVGISMASLVICLIIEAIIWRKIRRNTTSYLRHVSIVNIAVSLLIADIWFIIGAAISDAKKVNQPACTAATFFIHFFYLALFFWMLASALLLFYRTVSVFDGGLSKNSMLAIGFSLGYGGPLIIAVITIAVTAPQKAYIRDAGVCWLNWDKSQALLAFVIPALTIVVINLLILLVVIYKMLRRRVGDSAQAAERHVMVIIARSLAVLTPFFGLTWGLGAGTLAHPNNRGINISFAFFNSLQGFFILVFGTLLDKKVCVSILLFLTAYLIKWKL